jgi:acyl dehydratase
LALKTDAVGKTYEPVSYAVGREKVREFASAVGEEDPCHHDPEAAREAGYADVVAPPMFAVVYSGRAMTPALFDPEVGIDFARMVHGGQEFVWDAPVVAGDEITTELKVTPDKYLTYRYAGASGDFNPIHIDAEFAQSVGLPGRILHGLWMMAQVARAVSAAGDGPESLRRLEVQFRGMGFPEQEIVVNGSVKRVEDGVATVEAEAVQDGRRIIRKGQAELRVG